MSTELDEKLLAKVMSSVRIEVRFPLCIRFSAEVSGKEIGAEVMLVEFGSETTTTQKKFVSIASKWNVGFEVGTRYIIERIPYDHKPQ